MTQAEKYAVDTIGHKPDLSEPQVYGDYLIIRDAYEKGRKECIDKVCEWWNQMLRTSGYTYKRAVYAFLRFMEDEK